MRLSFNEALFALLVTLSTLGCGTASPPLAAVPAPAHTHAPACMDEGAKSQELIAAPCSEGCSSFRVVQRQCERGVWRELAPIEPVCVCTPESLPASLQGCRARDVVLTPTYEGSSDGASLVLTCGDTSLEVACDGENDGTGTSLCTCQRDGQHVRMVGDPWPGEGIAVAYRAAERCLATTPKPALPSAKASCKDRERSASDAVAAALAGAKSACKARSDCERVTIDTACHAACGAVIATADEAKLLNVIDEQNATICRGFEADGCQRLQPPCAPPSAFACVKGECREIERSEGECVSRELSWGHSGGMTRFHEEHTLKACASYGLEHTEHRNADKNTACANEVRANARVGVRDVNAALAHADVLAAIKAAPQLFGYDQRPVDGSVYRIEIEGAVIELGGECSAEPSCKPIPAGLRKLRDVLSTLAEQQRAIAACRAI